MKSTWTLRTGAVAAALALVIAACGGDDGADAPTDDDQPETAVEDDGPVDDAGDGPADGPTIVVSSFNFPESEILGEIYAQALESAGYPVERMLNLGSRELIYPELLGGDIDLLPEYLGSALVVWFGQDSPLGIEAAFTALTEAFAPEGVSVLEPAPAENNQAFVVASAFAEANAVSTLGDLADLGPLTFSGPPECEDRDTCYRGLVNTYGLEDLEFVSNQEAAARLASLDEGDSDLILLFSTDAPLAGDAYVVLADDAGMLPPENITPVLRTEVLNAYGDELAGLLEDITSRITTDALQSMNAQASEGLSAAEIAAAWLSDNA